jgi:putative flippase GtrA
MMNLPKPKSQHIEIAKFASVGIINTAIDFILLSFFVWLGINLFLALAMSYTIGAANGYLLNNHWTYRHLKQPSTWQGFIKYAAISFVGLGLTEIIVYILYHGFHWGVTPDKLVAIVVVFTWNYIANKKFTFAGH